MNRSLAPKIHRVQNIAWTLPTTFEVGKYCTLFYLEDENMDTCKIDFSFYLNKSNLNILNVLSFKLLTSGNNSISATKIKEEFDYLGAYVDIQVYTEVAEISIYVLKQNLIKSIDVLFKNLQTVSFPRDEFDIALNEKKSSFQINSKKISSIARKEYQQRIFWNTPLAKTTALEDFKQISVDDIRRTFQKDILESLFQVSLVGSVKRIELNHILGTIEPWQRNKSMSFHGCEKNEKGEFFFAKDDALQSAIRIGNLCMNKRHPDYIEFSILNTFLGDYFGSRLMKNIREDKGYTYGIGSMVQHLRNVSYFTIATQVAKKHRESTMMEIKKEIDILQNDRISEKELTLVGNYLTGQSLKAADGSFAQMSLFLNAKANGLEMSFYNDYLQSLNSISPKRMQDLAQIYLSWDSFSVITVG